MRTLVEQSAVSHAVDDAQDRWPRAADAWAAVTWVIVRDPEIGTPVTQTGRTRSFVLHGARSIGLPNVTVIYEITEEQVIVHDALFEDGIHEQAGNA